MLSEWHAAAAVGAASAVLLCQHAIVYVMHSLAAEVLLCMQWNTCSNFTLQGMRNYEAWTARNPNQCFHMQGAAHNKIDQLWG